MSLIDEFKEDFYIMNRTSQSDGEGGTTYTWTEGTVVSLTMRHDTTTEAMKAEAEGVTSTYSCIFSKNISLNYNDVVKRVSDGQIFRITSNSFDKKTPASSALNLTSVTAEKWELI